MLLSHYKGDDTTDLLPAMELQTDVLSTLAECYLDVT